MTIRPTTVLSEPKCCAHIGKLRRASLPSPYASSSTKGRPRRGGRVPLYSRIFVDRPLDSLWSFEEVPTLVTSISEDDAANGLVENIDFPRGGEENRDSP